MAFYEVVLRAFLQGLRGNRLVVQPSQYHQGDVGRSRVGALNRRQSLRIGQPQVQQDYIDRVLHNMLLGVSHALNMRQLSVERAFLVQHLAEKARVSGVVFDQQNSPDTFLRHQLRVCCGSLTFFNQKSVMFFMSASNSSNCTGFVT